MKLSPRLFAILQALFVTFLWSTSWVLIKRSLAEIPPLTFAGLRYMLAFLILLPWLWRSRDDVRQLSARQWRQLIVLGFVFYTLTQGGQFVTLNHLQAVTFSLLLNFSAVIVAVFGIVALNEVPSRLQWAGIGLFLLGVLLYFAPFSILVDQWLGFVLAMVTVCANAAASILGRSVNRAGTMSPLIVTGISMGIGATVLLGSGLAVQGLPPLSLPAWFTIVWLAVVNTAFAFVLWNVSLQRLTAVESTIINNTMLIQIALLAWLFLDEPITLQGGIGLGVAATGIFIVNANFGRTIKTTQR